MLWRHECEALTAEGSIGWDVAAGWTRAERVAVLEIRSARIDRLMEPNP